jgi:hypothetical protein
MDLHSIRTFEHAINKTIFQGGLSAHEIIPVQIFRNLICRLSGKHGVHLHQIVANAHDLGGLDLNILRLSPRPAHGLMDHDARAGESEALALGTGRQDEGGHGCGEAEVDGNDFAFDKLHCIEDGQAGDDRSSRAVDVEVDGFGAVFFVEVEHHADDLVGEFIIDLGAQEDDTLSI